MRARRREINIFNMSLLDILCGALGAFCFMMIVALPYYIPPGKARDLRKSQEETAKLMHDLEKMKERLPDQKSVEEMEAMLKRLEAQIKALQGQVNILTAEKEDLERKVNQLTNEKAELQQRVNQLTAENQELRGRVNQLTAERDQLAQEKQELQAKNQSLEEEKRRLQAQLLQRTPFTIIARANDWGQSLDMITIPKAATEKGPIPMFNTWLDGHLDIMNEMRNALLYGRGVAMGVVTDRPPGAQFKLYLRLSNPAQNRGTTAVDSALITDMREGPPIRLPKVTLFAERFWILLGTITIDPNYHPIFKEATAEEREAEWKTLTNATPPPTPTPTPPPSAAERAAAEADRAKYEAQRAKLQEAHKKLSKLMQLGFDEKNEAEILQLADELLKELPPRHGMRREVESRLEHILEMKARREGGQPQRSPAPNEKVSPSPRQPAPVPSPS